MNMFDKLAAAIFSFYIVPPTGLPPMGSSSTTVRFLIRTAAAK